MQPTFIFHLLCNFSPVLLTGTTDLLIAVAMKFLWVRCHRHKHHRKESRTMTAARDESGT